MTVTAVQERCRLIAIWSWGLMAFCLPFSTALTLIFSAFGVLFGLVGFDWASFKKVIRNPIAILCVALFVWLALSMLWSIAPRDEMIEGISKYRKLLYVPLVAMLLVSTRVKPWFLMNFFVAGCFLVCIGSLFSSSGLASLLLGPQLPWGGWFIGGSAERYWFYIGPPEKPTFGRAHIAQGAFLTFALMYMLGRLLAAAMQKSGGAYIRVWVLIPALVFVSITILNLGGMTGNILLLLGVLAWVLFFFRARNGRLAVSLFSGAILFFVIAFYFNSNLQKRVTKSAEDIALYFENGANTSEGLRLRLWEAGLMGGVDRAFAGSGVGSFAELYSRDEAEPEDLRVTRPHPHSEYILQYVQAGAIGLILFLGIAIITMYRGYLCMTSIVVKDGISSNDFINSSIFLVAALYFADGIFNSVVWDLAEGHFFVILISLINQLMTSRE